MAQQILYVSTNDTEKKCLRFANNLASSLNKNLITTTLPALDAEAILKELDIILFVCQISSNSSQRKQIKQLLKEFREVRVPYLFVKENSSFNDSTISNIIAPVNFLPEEKEKASWCNNLGRLLNSDVTLIKPKDHGSRAAKNVAFISGILAKTQVPATIIDGNKSSSKIEFEALNLIKNQQLKNPLLMISASREYSLDDIFLGPKEQHVALKAEMPLLIINPRDDIYELCGD